MLGIIRNNFYYNYKWTENYTKVWTKSYILQQSFYAPEFEYQVHAQIHIVYYQLSRQMIKQVW